VGLLIVSAYSTVVIRDFHYSQIEGDLEARAQLVAGQVEAALDDGDPSAVDSLCKSLPGPTRITVILPSGAVAGDSDEDPASMDNHADRPEVAGAMAGRADSSVRFSHTLRQRMMYVAIPLERSGDLVAVLRTSVSVSAIDAVLGRIHARTSVLVLAVAAVAAVVSSRPRVDIGFDYSAMAVRAKDMLRGSLDALMQGDADLARTILTADQDVDDMHREMYQRVAEATRRDPSHVETLQHLTGISRHLERIADHATNIAEDVIYMLEGDIVRHGRGSA